MVDEASDGFCYADEDFECVYAGPPTDYVHIF